MTSNLQNQTSVSPGHIVCFVAMPFKDNDIFKYETVLLPALRQALELEPYYWEVARADEQYFANIIQNNVQSWMNRVQVYIADVSEENPNVMMELGYMLWTRKPDQPLLILKREGTNRTISDLAGFIYTYYPNVSNDVDDDFTIDKLTRALRLDFNKRDDMRELNRQKTAHYLSPLYLHKDLYLPVDVARKLSEYFNTMESVKDASSDEFDHKAFTAGINPDFMRVIRENIIKKLNKLKNYPGI